MPFEVKTAEEIAAMTDEELEAYTKAGKRAQAEQEAAALSEAQANVKKPIVKPVDSADDLQEGNIIEETMKVLDEQEAARKAK